MRGVLGHFRSVLGGGGASAPRWRSAQAVSFDVVLLRQPRRVLDVAAEFAGQAAVVGEQGACLRQRPSPISSTRVGRCCRAHH
eukprot:13526359-Alexandrium_andersonii.AAC.1